MKANKFVMVFIVLCLVVFVGCETQSDDSYHFTDSLPEISTVKTDSDDQLEDEISAKEAAEKAAAEKAAAEKAAEKAAAEKAAAEKAAAEKAAAEKAAAEKAAAEKAAAEKAAAEKAAAEKAAAEKAAAEKAAAEKAAAEKAAAEKAAAEKAAAEKAAAEKAAEEAANKIAFVEFQDTVYRNNINTITIKGKPNTEYELKVRYASGWSKAKGVGKAVSDANGMVSWTFKIGGKTTEEDFIPYVQIKGNGETVERNFFVADGD